MKAQNLTQKDLAKLCGVSERSIYRYLNGLTEPKGDTFLKIAQALNTTTDYLIGNSHQVSAKMELANVKEIILKTRDEWSRQEKMELVECITMGPEEDYWRTF